MLYTIWIVTPSQYAHSQAFSDVAASLNESLIELGHTSKIVTSSFECRGRTIILGANLLSKISREDLPRDIVIYNLEQIFPGSPWLSNTYLYLLRGKFENHSFAELKINFEVWDYSQANIDELAKINVHAKLCEIGYSPSLTTIGNSQEPDIDILHVGSITERRINIINALAEAGHKVHFAFGVYGKERNDLIARSKIVLNIHFYESRVFEIVRCSHLMANRKCIVSETGSGGEEYNEGICFSDYGDIVANCNTLLGDSASRTELAQRGFDIFSKRSQTEMLKAIL